MFSRLTQQRSVIRHTTGFQCSRTSNESRGELLYIRAARLIKCDCHAYLLVKHSSVISINYLQETNNEAVAHKQATQNRVQNHAIMKSF